MRRALWLGIVLALTAPASAIAHPAGVPRTVRPSRCRGADTPATAGNADQMRSAVVCLINRQRRSRHLPPLRASAQLNRSAQGWTDVMVATGLFSHGLGDAFAQRISATGFAWQAAGENIAAGYPTPRLVVTAWMASPDHCRNILDPSFRSVGTGVNPRPVADASNGPATWTQDFALSVHQSPLSANRGPMNGCPY